MTTLLSPSLVRSWFTPELESLAGVAETLSVAQTQAQAGLHSSHCLGAGWWLEEAVAVAGSVLFSQ